VLKFTDYSDPTPGPGEVLIRVAAASINPIDLLQRSGATKDFFPVEFPGIIGRDVSGAVLERGCRRENIAPCVSMLRMRRRFHGAITPRTSNERLR
jgi:NADPH:quinone reductase-like Zn-dependent oxidoreductase